MDWLPITTPQAVDAMLRQSAIRPQILLKHSTRCSISTMAKARVERQQPVGNLEADFLLLLVVEHRPASNHAAEVLGVHHESPQLIVVRNGEVLLDQSHYEVNLDEVAEVLHTA